ncbi:extracellular solute-binding protein, partial [uncultured Arthrobacter sp.]|uniref:extracellular solute-binding protein n=1 Tax=uncultured Arthrobacter sp. TaxID=114050 RepID=UPI0032180C77
MKRFSTATRVLSVAALTIMGAGLAGCGGGAGGGSAESATTAKGPIKIWYSNNEFEVKWGKAMVESWNTAHPDQKIDAQEIPAGKSSEEVIGAAITAGNAPCLVFNTAPVAVPQFQKQGGLVALDSFPDGAQYIEERTGDLADQYKSGDGKMYQLPWKSNPVVLFYNKDHFRKSGVAFPTKSWKWADELAAAKRLTNLISSTANEISPRYSPDGKRIAFESNRSGSSEIWVCNSDGENPIRVTSFRGPLAGSPSWSPDGKFLAIDCRPEGNADIYVISSEGGTPRRLTSDPAEDIVPSWSQDGRWIYFSSHRNGRLQIWKVPAEGGEAIQMTQQGGFDPVESPDGKWLAISDQSQEQRRSLIYVVPIMGGTPRRVTPLAPSYW